MADMVDHALSRLRLQAGTSDLDGLEQSVFARIDSEAKGNFSGRTLQVQALATCAALLMGLMVAKFIASNDSPVPSGLHHPAMSEVAVLSDDSFLAPSIRLEGGI